MRKTYGTIFGRVAAGQFDEIAWPLDADGLVSFVILSHKLGRHIHRNQLQAYNNDEEAMRRVKKSIDLGLDRKVKRSSLIVTANVSYPQVPIIERQFIYLPFMFSEDPNDHVIGREMFCRTVQDAIDGRAYEHIQAKAREFLKRFEAHTAVC
jgi:uncharacterized protein (DUF924 family)